MQTTLTDNRLDGATGDAINAMLVAAEHNMRLFAAWLTALFTAWLPACEPALLTA